MAWTATPQTSALTTQQRNGLPGDINRGDVAGASNRKVWLNGAWVAI